jgi:two-component system CitB family sensor kinase
VTVSDTGPGIPEEHQAAIFSDGFTTKATSGRGNHGLGLALVHRLVHRAGGMISVERPDATVFTVVLPVRVPDPVTART